MLFNSARDISARKSVEAEVRKLAYFDFLTGLPNRRLLMERLERAQASCARDGTVGALLFIDLDNFKAVNDTVGHQEGDRLLVQVASILARCVRKDDTVARLGGDEFIVMLEALAGEGREAAEQAAAVGNKILAALNQRFQLGSSEHRTSVSIGVSLFGELADEPIDEPLQTRRHGDVPGQARRTQRGVLLRPLDAGRRARARRRRGRAVGRAGAAAVRVALPATGRRGRDGARPGGAGALASPGAWPGAAGRVHSARRGVRLDPSARTLGARGRLRAAGGVGGPPAAQPAW